MTFKCQFLLLLLQRFVKFLLLAVAFLALQLFRRNGLAGTRLRMGVVCRPPRTLFGVFLLPPLGTAILEPNLEKFGNQTTNEFSWIDPIAAGCQFKR